jgi:hypothetical protein
MRAEVSTNSRTSLPVPPQAGDWYEPWGTGFDSDKGVQADNVIATSSAAPLNVLILFRIIVLQFPLGALISIKFGTPGIKL